MLLLRIIWAVVRAVSPGKSDGTSDACVRNVPKSDFTLHLVWLEIASTCSRNRATIGAEESDAPPQPTNPDPW